MEATFSKGHSTTRWQGSQGPFWHPQKSRLSPVHWHAGMWQQRSFITIKFDRLDTWVVGNCITPWFSDTATALCRENELTGEQRGAKALSHDAVPKHRLIQSQQQGTKHPEQSTHCLHRSQIYQESTWWGFNSHPSSPGMIPFLFAEKRASLMFGI